MRALVIGFGSIGRRHARILTELGCEVAVVSRRAIEHSHAFKSIDIAITQHQPEYVVVASATAEHLSDILALAELGFTGRVLVEKPFFSEVSDVPAHEFASLRVGYNLRFHPVMQGLEQLLAGQELLSIQIYVGQYLPNWRPDTDYRTSYSASAERGGGVLLDLSHDIDYLLDLAGECTGLAALGGKLSDLEIVSDDVFALLLQTAGCPVAVLQLNYVDRVGSRELIVNSKEFTARANLVSGELYRNSELIVHAKVDQDATYLEMHKAMMKGNADQVSSVEEALAVLEVVSAARESARNGVWIQR